MVILLNEGSDVRTGATRNLLVADVTGGHLPLSR
jgi:hypothetical protein